MNIDIQFLALVFPALYALVGFPASVAALINLAKVFGLADGQAPKVTLVLNFIGFVLVFYLIATGNVGFLSALDIQLGILANFIVSFTAFAIEVGLTKVFHNAFKGLPWIGFSYSSNKK